MPEDEIVPTESVETPVESTEPTQSEGTPEVAEPVEPTATEIAEDVVKSEPNPDLQPEKV